MRLKRRKRGSFVKLTGCALVLALTIAVVGPEIGRTFAAEDQTKADQEVPVSSSTQVENVFTVEEATNSTEPQTGSAEVVNTFTVSDSNSSVEITPSNPQDVPVEFEVQEEASQQSASANVDFDFTVQEYIQITTDQTDPNNPDDINVAIEANDVSPNNFASESAEFDVSSNSATGFGVYVYAGEEGATELKSTTVGNASVIAPIAGNLTPDQFTANTWGYNVTLTEELATTSVLTFSPIMTATGNTLEPVYTTDFPSAGTKLTLTCGTKIDQSLPVDTYQTGVFVSAVAPLDALVPKN